MRKLSIIGLMLMVFNVAWAQEIKPPDKPQTHIEKFLLKRGALFEKTFHDIGEVGLKGSATLAIKVIEILNVNEESKIAGAILELQTIDKYSVNSVSAYLDHETLNEFLSALETINVKASKMKPNDIPYTEIYFKTTNDIMIGFYQEGIKQSGFLKLNDWQSDARGYFGLNRFPEIIGHLKTAQEKILSL